MAALSENNIKRVALGFLKAHYRYRPRVGRSELQHNMRAEGGIIIDGVLRYEKEEGKYFVATVEATSYMTREEVRYRIQQWLLFWDSVAVGSIAATLGLAVAHFQDWIDIYVLGWEVWSLFTLLGIFVFGVVYAGLFFGLRRYRYIYAVEQFKRYYADEQWIAIGEDVFPSKEDRFYQELHEQCIYNGFGLIIIDREMRPHLQITPSRSETFGQDRERVEFFSLDEFTRRLQEQMGESRWQQWLGWLPWQVSGGGGNQKLLRFRKSYINQIAISLISVLLILNIFYQELQERPEAYVDEQGYEERMKAEKENETPEPAGYLVDSTDLRPFKEEVSPYLNVGEEPLPPESGPVERRPGLIVYEPGSGFFDYDCERLYSGNEVSYVIAVEIFDTERTVRQLIQQFKERGLEAMGLWLGCFSTKEDDFVLFLQQLYATRSEAEGDLPGLQERIDREGMSAKLEILSLRK